MIKEIIAYQRLLFNTALMNSSENKNQFVSINFIFILFVMFFMNGVIFNGNTPSPVSIFCIILPTLCVWQINIIYYNKERLFELVPVSRSFTVINTFLFAFVIGLIVYIIQVIIGFAFVGTIFGLLYLFASEGLDESPPEVVNQVIDTAKADILVFNIMIIILFVGTAIVFIKNKKTRTICYSVSAIVGYGLLYILKFNMPVSPNTGNVEFLESFAIMPQANIILIITTIVGILLCVFSVVFGNKMYR